MKKPQPTATPPHFWLHPSMGRRQALRGLAWAASAPALGMACGDGENELGSTDDVGGSSGSALGATSNAMAGEAGGPSGTGGATAGDLDGSGEPASSEGPSQADLQETGAAGGGAADADSMAEPAGDQQPSPAEGSLVAPPWDGVPSCQASPTDGAGQGPFYIHDGEREDDVSLVRQDIRGRYDADAEPGTEMQLHLRLLDAGSDACDASPVEGVEVYIWHTDAQGFYSGFGDPGDQTPDEPYAGVPNQNDLNNTDRFCRGMQVTNADGVVSFRSIFPGWYNGRDIHIHVLVLERGSAARSRVTYTGGDHLFTTQLYFEPALSDSVHQASEPYLRRTLLSAYQGSIQADEPGNSGLRALATFENGIVVAQMQLLLPFD